MAASKGSVPGTEDQSAPKDAPTTNLRQNVPYSKDDGTVGYKDVPQPEGPQIRYIGAATRRILTPADWETVGVDDTEHKTYVWDITNAKMVPRSKFSAKQLDYLRTDNRFVVEGD